MNVLHAAGIEDTQIVQNKVCFKCQIEKPLSSFRTDKRGTRNVCISCRNFHQNIAIKGKKNWLKEGKKIPNNCDCCGKTTDKIVFDHDHKTFKHRGWLCHQCNQGIGLLGDNLTDLKNAVRYLEECEFNENT
tara:strand:- start:680 stop:1075 length:396 start_codon:yes stop_codon:yes gene_type:complete